MATSIVSEMAAILDRLPEHKQEMLLRLAQRAEHTQTYMATAKAEGRCPAIELMLL